MDGYSIIWRWTSDNFCNYLLILCFNFEFYFLRRYCTTVALLYIIGATLLQMCHKLLDSDKFVTMGERVLATLCIGCQRLLATLGQNLRGYCQLLQIAHIFQRAWLLSKEVVSGYCSILPPVYFLSGIKNEYFGTFQPGDKLALYDCLLE